MTLSILVTVFRCLIVPMREIQEYRNGGLLCLLPPVPFWVYPGWLKSTLTFSWLEGKINIFFLTTENNCAPSAQGVACHRGIPQACPTEILEFVTSLTE